MISMIEMTSMIEIQIIRANMENSSIESMISMVNLTSIMQEKATIATLKHSNRDQNTILKKLFTQMPKEEMMTTIIAQIKTLRKSKMKNLTKISMVS